MSKKITCHVCKGSGNTKTFVTCNICKGFGAGCIVCKGKGKLREGCHMCSGTGWYKLKDTITSMYSGKRRRRLR